jgi:hypothetical protein
MADATNNNNNNDKPSKNKMRSRISFNQDDTLIHIYELKSKMFTNNMKEQDQKVKQMKEDQKLIESIRKKNLENEKLNNEQRINSEPIQQYLNIKMRLNL